MDRKFAQSIAEFLGDEFAKRKHRNKSYSLRAYARDLKISPSRLSEVLKGDHGISEESADKMADALRLSASQRKMWKDLILSQSARSGKVRELAQKRLDEAKKENSVRKIKEEQFRVISDWYHAAILELIDIPGFQSEPLWISEKLGISQSQAEDAIQRLLQLGLLTWQKNILKARPEAYATFTELPSAAVRKFHRQILGMHHESILQDPMNEREVMSMIMALPKSAMAEFGQEMKTLVTHFWEKYQEHEKEELYSISLQMCPVKNRKRNS